MAPYKIYFSLLYMVVLNFFYLLGKVNIYIYTYIYMLNVNLKISDLKVIKKQTIEGK